jgi:hypothetical protein
MNRKDNKPDGDDKKKKKDMKKKDNKSLSNNNEIKDVLKSALHSYLVNQAKEIKNRTRDMQALNAVVGEFLNSFILLGYSPSGEPIHIISAHNQQEADSLSALLNKYLFNQRDGKGSDDLPLD